MNKAKRRRKLIEPTELVAPTAEQVAKGGYRRTFVTHVETATVSMAHISDHDPVERWDRAGRLSDSQRVAIGAVRRLWQLAGLQQRTTSAYGERIHGNGDAEIGAITKIQARKDLYRIQDRFVGLETYWSVFENVCRHGMSAGVAGSELGFGSRSAQERAHTVVCFVADVIAMKERL